MASNRKDGSSTSIPQVQSTNDRSIVSKQSMCRRGYFSDPFLKYFVPKEARRSPLINRGYYIRAKAINCVVTSFIEQHHLEKVQILSLGAGFDTTYFRLHKDGKLSSCKYFEVDYPEVVSRKADVLESIPEYQHLVQRKSDETCGCEVVTVGLYTMFGCDITDVQKLEKLLRANRIELELPTLLIAECVLSYIDPDKVDSLLHWCAHFFQNAVFCSYEQIHPDDRFGLVMLEHFESRGSPLKGLSKYFDRESHEKRYLSAGWKRTLSCDMNDFYMSLSPAERSRVESLELFDEFEEWHLKCSHYIILCATTGQSSSYIDCLPFSPSSKQCSSSANDRKLSISVKLSTVGRYAHCSVQRPDGEIVAYGGFGCSPTDGLHSRLGSMIGVTVSDPEPKVRNIELCGDEPGSLMHQRAVLLPGGDILMYGGRTSPGKANSDFFLFSSCSDKMVVKKLPLASSIPGRWRHSMTHLSVNGVSYVLIIGGRSETCSALDDCWLLNVEEFSLTNVSLTLPEGRHSHSTLLYKEGVVVIGGVDSSTIPLPSVLYLQYYLQGKVLEWKSVTVDFTPPLPARYGASSTVAVDNIAWLVGGVSLTQFGCCEILMLDLTNKTWQGYNFPSPVTKEYPLLINCTVHRCRDSELVTLGGGGNLFSFGTCLNNYCLATAISIS